MSPGDKVILATFAEVDAAEAAGWQPTVVFVDGANRSRARAPKSPARSAPHCERLTASLLDPDRDDHAFTAGDRDVAAADLDLPAAALTE